MKVAIHACITGTDGAADLLRAESRNAGWSLTVDYSLRALGRFGIQVLLLSIGTVLRQGTLSHYYACASTKSETSKLVVEHE